MLSKILVIVIFVAILASLASGAVTLVRGKDGDSARTAKALSFRIGLSVSLFALLFVLWGLGLITPNSFG